MNDSTAPVPNIPLLRKAVEWAEAEAAKPHPQERLWAQRSYAEESNCGTAYCIAGWAVMAAQPGAELVLDDWADEYLLSIDGELASWFDTGQRLLGLTVDEAAWLFSDDNSIERVREVAEQIAARAGERL